jgi:beta-xylosidase
MKQYDKLKIIYNNMTFEELIIENKKLKKQIIELTLINKANKLC